MNSVAASIAEDSSVPQQKGGKGTAVGEGIKKEKRKVLLSKHIHHHAFVSSLLPSLVSLHLRRYEWIRDNDCEVGRNISPLPSVGHHHSCTALDPSRIRLGRTQ